MKQRNFEYKLKEAISKYIGFHSFLYNVGIHLWWNKPKNFLWWLFRFTESFLCAQVRAKSSTAEKMSNFTMFCVCSTQLCIHQWSISKCTHVNRYCVFHIRYHFLKRFKTSIVFPSEKHFSIWKQNISLIKEHFEDYCNYYISLVSNSCIPNLPSFIWFSHVFGPAFSPPTGH